MRIFIIDTLYSGVIDGVYHKNPELVKSSYQKQKQSFLELKFGTSDFYSNNLANLGILAEEFFINVEPIQNQWAFENLNWFRHRFGHSILEEQIRKFGPDIIYCQSLNDPGPDFFRKIKNRQKIKIIGQFGSKTTMEKDFLSAYDLILTSFPHYVSRVKNLGINCEYFRIAFEPEIIKLLHKMSDKYGAVFVGGFSGAHTNTFADFEYLCHRERIDVWGYGRDYLDKKSPILKHFHSENLWGKDMYNLFYNSKIVINRHGAIAENYANNMRLYEATGVGSMLITDYKDNLSELFALGKEIETYKTKEELVDKVKYYLKHDNVREKIAKAGQNRTVRDHSYSNRMGELKSFIARYFENQLSNKVSRGYKVISKPDPAALLKKYDDAWKNERIPDEQLKLTRDEINRFWEIPAMKCLVESVKKFTGCTKAKVLEIGCSTGYLGQIFKAAGLKCLYYGCDYSSEFIKRAKELHPQMNFKTCDARKLSYPSNSFNIVISGCCLLHIVDYEKAIKEAARVSKKFVIFHRTPVLHSNLTKFTTKVGYGVEMVEIVFNENELVNLFGKYGLRITEIVTHGTFTLPEISEQGYIKNYVCIK